MLIYVATNLINGKRYIGVTTRSLCVRWRQHKQDARASAKTILHKAIRKYGPDAFRIEEFLLLAPWSTLEDLLELEQEVILQEETIGRHGYNMVCRGQSLPVSEETRRRMSIARRATVGKRARWKFGPRSTEHRQKLGASWTEERRAKASQWLRSVRTAPQRGKSFSDEHRRRLSATWTPERKAALAERNRLYAKGL